MDDADGVRLLALPPSVAADRPVAALADVDEHYHPDGVCIPGPGREPRAAARARQAFDVPVVHPPLAGETDAVRTDELGGVAVVTIRSSSIHEQAATAVEKNADKNGSLVLVCDDVETIVRPTTLEATLGGIQALARIVPENHAHLTVLTGGESMAYDRVWTVDPTDGRVVDVTEPTALSAAGDGNGALVHLRVIGTGSIDGYGDGGTIASYELSPAGESFTDESECNTWPVQSVKTCDANAFGLRAVSGIGPKTAERLSSRGVVSRTNLLKTPVDQLASLPGVGHEAATTMRRHATVLNTGDPVITTSESLPAENRSRPPLCVDIETDGLSPTIIWQIGVYDPETDEYRSFVERRDPSDPERIIEAFVEWVVGAHADRVLLTWNGWRFDYRHLGAFVNRYVPDYADEWEAVTKFDLYRWAVTDGNAILPGRTNTLDDVSAALDYHGAGTGLDGAATAAAYTRFVRTGEELDWTRHERYCEDDCRALWHVYERLEGATRVTEAAAKPTGQTGLSDF